MAHFQIQMHMVSLQTTGSDHNGLPSPTKLDVSDHPVLLRCALDVAVAARCAASTLLLKICFACL